MTPPLGQPLDLQHTHDRSFGDPTSDLLIELLRQTGIGGRLPSERELAEQLMVSRTLLRDRLGVLESLGVVRRRTGAGTFVAGLDPVLLGRALNVGLILADHTTESLQDVRIALERQAAKQAAHRQDRLAIAHMHIALDTIKEQGSAEAEEQADFDFHKALLDASGNPSVRFFADALGLALRRSFAERRRVLEQLPNMRSMMDDLHQQIFDAVVAGDGDAAMAAVDVHFDTYAAAVEASAATIRRD